MKNKNKELTQKSIDEAILESEAELINKKKSNINNTYEEDDGDDDICPTCGSKKFSKIRETQESIVYKCQKCGEIIEESTNDDFLY